MSPADAREFVKTWRVDGHDDYDGKWIDPLRVATDTFRDGVIAKLSRDPELRDDHSIALAEIHLSEALPDIDHFHGIFDVDDVGIWYYDGDGHINEAIWRQRVIPWHAVSALTLHAAS